MRRSLLSAAAYGLAVALALGAGADSAAAKQKHRETLNVGKDPFGDIPKGPLHIIISIDQQRLHLYSNGFRIAEAPVSTGVPGHPTPTGVFSVIEKDRHHRSNIYSGAPMPYMHRITWSGVAIHEGQLPGYPASHGCIRMPRDFAARLWVLSRLGARVIIARGEVTPFAISDPRLFVRKDKRPVPVAAAPGAEGVRTAQALDPTRATDAVATGGPAEATVISTLELKGPLPAVPATAVADATADAAPDGEVIPADSVPLPEPRPADLDRILAERRGPIAVFVSRKEGKVFVRQKFTPLFDAPVTIREADKPLGTHVFTAMQYLDDGASFHWTAVSMPGDSPKADRRARSLLKNDRGTHAVKGRRKAHEPAAGMPPEPPPQTAREALARVEMPPEVSERIAELMIPGSSLIISDHGLGPETGKGTEFIVLTR
jgi:hypothetical protein